MQSPARPALLRYGASAAVVILAVLVRLALDPVLGALFPFATLFFAVLIAAGYGGGGPALLTTVLGALAAARFLLPPRGRFAPQGVENQGEMVLYLAVSLGISLLGGAIQAARRRAERDADEAARQREQLRITLASIGDAVLVTDAEGRVTSLNPVAEALTGWTAPAAAGQPLRAVFRIVNEETRREIENPVLRALREGTIVGLANHTVLIARDGTERPIDDSAAPIRDEAGSVVGAVLVFRDMSERRRVERDLVASEARKAAVLETALDAIITIDHEGRVVEWNPAAETTFGHARPEVLGREMCGLIIPPPLRDAHRRGMSRYLATGEGPVLGRRIETTAVRAEGTEFPVELAIARILTEGPPVFTAHVRDITERKQVEGELRDSEERFRGLMEQAPFSVQVFSPDGRIKRVNRAWEELWGVTLEMIPEYNVFADPQVEARGILPLIRRAFGGAVIRFPPIRYDPEETLPGRTRNADPARWIATVAYPIKDGAGQVREVVVVHEDITARWRAEEERERFFAVGADVLAVVGLDGYFKQVSPACERTLGWTPEELTSRPWADFLHPDEREATGALNRQVVNGGEVRAFENRYRHRDGSYRWLSWKARSFPEEGLIFAGATDVTDRRRSEAVLAGQKRVLERLVQGAPLADVLDALCQIIEGQGFEGLVATILLVDGDGRRLRSAAGRRAPAEYARAVDGMPIGPCSGSCGTAAYRGEPVVVTDIATDPLWTAYRDLALGHRLRACWSTPIVSSQGAVLGTFAVYYPTPRHPSPYEVGLVDILIRTAGIAIERRRAEEAVQDADRRKDDFLATLAHELRNPLAPIRNALHLMKESGGDGPGLEAERAMAERQVVHLARLIDDLMDVARISRGQIELRKQVVDLHTVVRQAVETARTQIDDRRHHLTVTLPDEPIRLEADPTRLEQVLWNLLHNAAKYTEPGGRIELAAEVQGSDAVLRVRDTGLGIEPAMLPRLFQMFVQAGAHRGHAQGGLGIGLGLVKTLVEMHGGSVVARSDGPGTGSEFVVRLPVLTAPPEGQTPGPGHHRDTGEKPLPRRILVVDDNVDAAVSLARLLTRLYGQEVRVAHDGPEALSVAGQFRPEVVLLDIGLPGMDGNEVARRLRRRPESEGALIVALTGWGQESDRQRSAQAGFDRHLVKPVAPEVLRDLLAGAGSPTRGTA